MCATVGYLVKTSNYGITLAMTCDYDQDDKIALNGVVFRPHGMIHSVKRLKR